MARATLKKDAAHMVFPLGESRGAVPSPPVLARHSSCPECKATAYKKSSLPQKYTVEEVASAAFCAGGSK